MIASVSGRVVARRLDHVVIEVGGVGLMVQCAPTFLATLREGETATVATSLVVREDSLTLFGFADDDTRAVFETVQTVSGVGPKLALAIVAVHRPDELRRIVATDDINSLTTVPGIGRKGAQRLILELKDRLGAPVVITLPDSAAARQGATDWSAQISTALMGLGWTAKDAERAVDVVAAELPTDEPTPDPATLLRLALRSLDSR